MADVGVVFRPSHREKHKSGLFIIFLWERKKLIHDTDFPEIDSIVGTQTSSDSLLCLWEVIQYGWKRRRKNLFCLHFDLDQHFSLFGVSHWPPNIVFGAVVSAFRLYCRIPSLNLRALRFVRRKPYFKKTDAGFGFKVIALDMRERASQTVETPRGLWAGDEPAGLAAGWKEKQKTQMMLNLQTSA
ncbi:hypothetical protein C8R44DRAFT_749164 [Mycena epipterygia]|nr:hypothetical protein C8R44DRAFT_749164 [Mycena epipterygia]